VNDDELNLAHGGTLPRARDSHKRKRFSF
jgi:hypothetical protein